MFRIGLAAAAGLAGWAGRLLFAAGLAGGAVGLYIALFASLGRRDPGHDWLFGLEFMGGGAVASVLAFAALCLPRRTWWRRGTRQARSASPQWYWYSFLLLGVTAVALLCLSCGLRLIGDWQRSNVTVTATASGCTADSSDSGTTYSCTYDWDWLGAHHRQNRDADEQYSDGREVDLWIDPVTGGADEHTYTTIVYSFIGAGGVGLFGLLLYVGAGYELYEHHRNFRRWLAGRAWWRTLPRPEPVVPAPVDAPVIEDAVPAAGVASGWVEDARPPGY